MKRPVMLWDKIFENHIFNKVPGCVEEVMEFSKKNRKYRGKI
jgi:hypothetical protein